MHLRPPAPARTPPPVTWAAGPHGGAAVATGTTPYGRYRLVVARRAPGLGVYSYGWVVLDVTASYRVAAGLALTVGAARGAALRALHDHFTPA